MVAYVNFDEEKDLKKFKAHWASLQNLQHKTQTQFMALYLKHVKEHCEYMAEFPENAFYEQALTLSFLVKHMASIMAGTLPKKESGELLKQDTLEFIQKVFNNG